MKKIALIIANGSEEIEALTPKDVLVRAGAVCDIVSVSDKIVCCSRGVKVVADKLVKDFDIDEYDGIIIPGGMPGSTNIRDCEKVMLAISKAFSDNKLVAGICASPAVVLKTAGVINGKKATCYPANEFINEIKEVATYTANGVEIDGNVITADGIKSAMDFALKICEYLGIKPKF